MNTVSEKKWFVYVGDHHEGPFSLADVREKMTAGLVTTESFVWAEGMPDWKAMSEVSEFSSLVLLKAPLHEPTPMHAPPLVPANDHEIEPEGRTGMIQAPRFSDEPEQEERTIMGMMGRPSPTDPAPAKKAEKPVESDPIESEPGLKLAPEPHGSQESIGVESPSPESPVHAVEDVPIEVELPEKTDNVPIQKKKFSGAFLTLVLTLLVLGGGSFAFMNGTFDSVLNSPSVHAQLGSFQESSRATLLDWSEKLPALEKWVSPLPPIDDVSPDEYELLKTAARENPQTAGVHIAFAVSKQNLQTPLFVLASRLPDGTQLKLEILGLPDTLVGQTSAYSETLVTLTRRLGRSVFVQGLPKGEYVIYISAGASQAGPAGQLLSAAQSVSIPPGFPAPKNAKILAMKTIFLGGTKDAKYASDLKAFQDGLRKKATDELSEVSQFVTTLEGQMILSQTQFTTWRKPRLTPKLKAGWSKFHTEWSKLQTQLDGIFAKWTPEYIQKEVFYGSLYLAAVQIHGDGNKLHEMHQAFFKGVSDLKAFDAQHAELLASLQSQITQFRTKVGLATSQLAASPGLPRKEGI
jgi:hypothetical protein